MREPQNIFQYIRRSFKRGGLKDGAARLYENKWCVKAVFQSLTPLAQQYIMRMTIANKSNNVFGADELNSWVGPGAPKVFSELRDLRIVNVRKKDGKRLIKMNSRFCEQLRSLLCDREVDMPDAQSYVEAVKGRKELGRDEFGLDKGNSGSTPMCTE